MTPDDAKVEMHREMAAIATKYVPLLEEGSPWWVALWRQKRTHEAALEREGERLLRAVR